MRRTAILTVLPAEPLRLARHFGDFVTIPVATVVFADLAGLHRLPLVPVGLAGWTLLEYLVHRFVFHRFSVGRTQHQVHHDHPSDPDAERSSLSTPLFALPVGCLLIAAAGWQDGSAIFAGLLSGYLAFITVHYAVHRSPVAPNSWLYRAKLRHLRHHRAENCNFGVTTIFWDVVFGTHARTPGAFPSEGVTGSREGDATRQESGVRFDSIKTERL